MMVSDDQRVENKQQKSTQRKNAALLLREDDMFPRIHYLYGISLDMTSLLGPRPPIIMIRRKEFHNLFTYLRVLQAHYGRILQSFLMNDCSSPHHSGKRKNSE